MTFFSGNWLYDSRSKCSDSSFVGRCWRFSTSQDRVQSNVHWGYRLRLHAGTAPSIFGDLNSTANWATERNILFACFKGDRGRHNAPQCTGAHRMALLALSLWVHQPTVGRHVSSSWIHSLWERGMPKMFNFFNFSYPTFEKTLKN